MKLFKPARQAAVAAAVLASLFCAGPAFAANHALIMWIGDYGSPRLNLPGIDLDAKLAREIAISMGVPSGNIIEVSNRQMTRQNIAAALRRLHDGINQGDKVFVYYSGHGYQSAGTGGARCDEAMVAVGPELYTDEDLQSALTALGSKASQVVMMNDSCFSGGAATKSMEQGTRSLNGAVAKFYPDNVKANSAITNGYQCGQATNKMTRNLEPVAAKTHVLYIAASTDTQVSYASPKGSIATLAWAACLSNARADTNRSGSINGQELKACAQDHINRNTPYQQTIMLQGEENLPLSFASSGSGGGGSNRVDASQALHDIQAGAAKDIQVSLVPRNERMRIGQDAFDFSVSSSRSGYLYILQVGSDGKTFNLLFPNKLDNANQISAGTHAFPRAAWRVRSSGPAGTSYLLAVVTQTPKDLSKGMDLSSTFASADATAGSFKTLVVEASGANGGSGGYGASSVVSISETN